MKKSRREQELANAKKNAAIEDAHKGFRTRVVLFWLFSNAALAFIVDNSAGILDLSDRALDSERVGQFFVAQMQGRKRYLALLMLAAYWLVVIRFIGVSARPQQIIPLLNGSTFSVYSLLGAEKSSRLV